MPCDYKEYHPKWSLISKMVRQRDGQRCKHCGVINGSIILRHGNKWRYIYRGGYSWNGAIKARGFTRITLTVAHLDHNKDNNDFSNLAALCQKCHLGHDIQQHAANRKYGRNHKGKHQLRLL